MSGKYLALKYRNAWTAGLLLLVLMAVCVRLRMLSMPLERDEGEFAYMGQLMRQGIPPYQLGFLNIKMLRHVRGVYGDDGAGENPLMGIHLGFQVFINLGTLALLCLLARRFLDDAWVLICCAAYVLLSLSPKVLGLQGHATNLVMICALAGLLALLRARDKPGPGMMFVSGLLFGLSFLCKQPGLFFGLFAFAVLARDGWVAGKAQWAIKRLEHFFGFLGIATPLALTCLISWRVGTFPAILVLDRHLCAGAFGSDAA